MSKRQGDLHLAKHEIEMSTFNDYRIASIIINGSQDLDHLVRKSKADVTDYK